METVLRIVADVLGVLVVLSLLGAGIAVMLGGAERPSIVDPPSNVRVLRPTADLADWEREGWA